MRPRGGLSPLAKEIAAIKSQARALGLTDAEIDAELAAYKVEQRSRCSKR